MRDPLRLNPQAIHTEHILHEFHISQDGVLGWRLYVAPKVMDASGSHKRFPNEVQFDDLKQGDVILAIHSADVTNGPNVIFNLRIWHVLGIEDDLVHIKENTIVGQDYEGEWVYDRLAGLIGAPPCDRD